MDPFTFLIERTAIMNTPITASNAVIPDVVKSTLKSTIETKVESSFVTIPPFCNPINATNKPIPTETPFFIANGIALKIASRIFVKDNTTKIKPSTKTASNANCQE